MCALHEEHFENTVLCKAPEVEIWVLDSKRANQVHRNVAQSSVHGSQPWYEAALSQWYYGLVRYYSCTFQESRSCGIATWTADPELHPNPCDPDAPCSRSHTKCRCLQQPYRLEGSYYKSLYKGRKPAHLDRYQCQGQPSPSSPPGYHISSCLVIRTALHGHFCSVETPLVSKHRTKKPVLNAASTSWQSGGRKAYRSLLEETQRD